jgi:hypothetical protein
MLRVCVVLLGFAVLSWGAEYKYSLYYSPGEIQSQVPPAKFLSQRERPAKSKRAAVDASSSKPPIAAHRGIFPFAGHAAATSFALREAGMAPQPVLRRAGFRAASLTYFAFRPPPAHSRLLRS